MNKKYIIIPFFLLLSLTIITFAELMYTKQIQGVFTANKGYELEITWSKNGSEVQGFNLGRLYVGESKWMPEIAIRCVKDGALMTWHYEGTDALKFDSIWQEGTWIPLDHNYTTHVSFEFTLISVLESGEYPFTINFELHD